MKKTIIGALAALSMIAVGATATVQNALAAGKDKVKVGFVYVGPVGDFGWSYQHDQGRLAVEQALGDKVETAFLESVPEGADAERAIEGLARSGHDLIFTTSFGYMDPTNAVAKKFPDIKFEHATGFKREHPNVSTYDSRFYEGRYVQGMIAGTMSKTGVAGYIASFPIPEVVQGINSFLLGAQSVNPDFKVKVVWVSTWFDPGKEADAAKSLLDQGADILTQHTDSTAAMQVAAERGALAFGQASDMIKFGPKTQLTAIIDDWAHYYVKRTKQVLDGTWNQQATWDGMTEEHVIMAPFTNMPAELAEKAAKLAESIKNDTFHPFTGPITKKDGTVFLKAGEVAEDGVLAGMNFYVKGMDSELPK